MQSWSSTALGAALLLAAPLPAAPLLAAPLSAAPLSAAPLLAAPPALATPTAATQTAATPTAAVFDFQLANLAQLPPTQHDKDRLPALSDQLRKALADSGKYKVIPLTPRVKDEVTKAAELRSCGGCAVTFAKQLGAQLAITAQVQKVSDLILDMTVFIKEVDTSKPEQAYSVSIRGDQDTSFQHGLKFLVKNNILHED